MIRQFQKPATVARMVAAGYRRDTPEGPHYYIRTRVEEVMSLARRLGMTRLGIAFCGGPVREARLLLPSTRLTPTTDDCENADRSDDRPCVPGHCPWDP